MGVVRDVTIEQLTQAIGGIDTSGLAKDITLQAVVSALQNLQINVNQTASNVSYNNSTSGLSATNVQGAIDEVFNDVKIKLDVIIKTNGSMNDVTSSGLYYLGNAVTDKPINIGGMFLAMFGNPNVAVGLYVGYVSSGIAVYRSNYSNGVWSHYAVSDKFVWEEKEFNITYTSTTNPVATANVDISKSGYTPIGVISWGVFGTSSTLCFVTALQVNSDNNTLYYAIRVRDNGTYNHFLRVRVLYLKN